MQLIKMLRTQTTALGVLASGVVYDFDLENSAQNKVYERLIDKKFAEKTSEAALKKAKAKAEKIAKTKSAPVALSPLEKIGQAVLDGHAAQVALDDLAANLKGEEDPKKIEALKKIEADLVAVQATAKAVFDAATA